ncbi:UNVERIFIED_CONTAM: Peroxidase 31 [Sesamum latifolium]|uniref:peroxidase n=1 Tax=Sesamum latifolium TaxID=2727402 RepID=A0AAW2Y7I2_9LAMI
MTPNKFDNMYYSNVQKGLGLLSSDHGLSLDPRTRGFVELYAKDEKAFFGAFARAMEKLSEYGIKRGRGERSDADAMPSTIEYCISFLFSGLICLNHFVFCVLTLHVYVIESVEEFKNYIEVNLCILRMNLGCSWKWGWDWSD